MEAVSAFGYGHTVNAETSINASLRDFTETFVDPFVNFLHDRIDEGSNMLYLLEKYKHKIEWFHRPGLLTQVRSNTRQSEAVADASLREYLFDQGVEYPFSTPSSPSGRADIVADIGEERPLILEVKLFDTDRGYDRAYLRQGFRQVHDYAADCGQSVGYLVIFNCTPQRIVFQTVAKIDTWPPRIELDHSTFFLITVDIASPSESASKRGPLQSYTIEESYLTSLESVSDLTPSKGVEEG